MCFKWLNKKIKKMVWFDVSLVKLSVVAFTLMLVAFWPKLASLDWYWYLILGLVFAIRPAYILIKK